MKFIYRGVPLDDHFHTSRKAYLMRENLHFVRRFFLAVLIGLTFVEVPLWCKGGVIFLLLFSQ